MEFWQKMQKLDNRIIYVIVFVCLAIPLLRPIGIPLTQSSNSKRVYDAVESLKEGDMVLMSLDYTPLVAPEVHPATDALSKHLFQKGVRVAYYGWIEEGPMFAEQIIEKYSTEFDLTYGTDVVNLGFVPGKEAGIRAIGDDVLKTVPRDFRGNVTKDMQIMRDVKSAKDFQLVISIGDGLSRHVQQMQAVHHITLIGASTSAAVSESMAYLNAGQIRGFLEGLRGAAEYEMLLGTAGPAVAKMDAQSLGHLVIIAFIVLGNISYFVTKREKNPVS